ncbi:MAG: DUF3017 domain-containing protein [Actinomycetia bacterium]|nr:DUF3017 domain-containing protein [Actinomycetes bacterium]
MSGAEHQPDLSPGEEEELEEFGPGPGAVPVVAERSEGSEGYVEPRPTVIDGLRLWWLPAAGLVVALAFLWTDHMWRAGASFAGSLWLAAGLRAAFPEERAGGLVVRSRWLDVLILVLAGGLVALSAFTLDLRDLRT